MSTPTARITGDITGDITVRRCMVTVTRRGGWSWGPDPRGLVQQMLGTLPDLLAEHFAEHLAGDGPDVEMVEPVTVTVRLGQSRWPVEVVVDSAPVVAESLPEPDAGSFEESFRPERVWSPPAVADMFAQLAERGELEPLLALLPDNSIGVYLLALSSEGASAPAALLLAELARRADPVLLARALPDADRSVVGSELVRSFTEFVTQVPSAEKVRIIESLTSVPPVEQRPRATAEVSSAVGETQVWSVLPFLLAGPLARIGYLDAIGPALAGVDLAEDAPLFAAALAYKVLGITERGWRRAEQDSSAAAAFAGLDSAVPEEELVAFARHVQPALPVLDGVLALSLCRGHEAAEPLLITGADGLLLVDAQGMFPIAWADDVAGLLPHWRACGRPPVLVCASSLPRGCLRQLASAGVRFVTDVRPLRGEPVSRAPWRIPLWTSGEFDPRLGAALPGHASRLADLVRILAEERQAVPLASDNALERSVTLAAGLGLGTIAWLLWGERETSDPVLALSRFADLDATVRFTPDAVRVRVPLGRRHADLQRAGLLSDVPDVVWLGGRTLTFSGG